MLIPLHQIAAVEDEAISALAAAFDRSYVQTAAMYLDLCRKDFAQLWRQGNLWAVTEVQTGKDGRILHIVAMAGDYTPELVKEMEDWGKSKGCIRSMFTGRKGWGRKVPDYQPKTITFEKEL